MKEIIYTCNVCGSDVNNKMYGICFDLNDGSVVFRKPESCRIHICVRCAKGVSEVYGKESL